MWELTKGQVEYYVLAVRYCVIAVMNVKIQFTGVVNVPVQMCYTHTIAVRNRQKCQNQRCQYCCCSWYITVHVNLAEFHYIICFL